MSPGEWIALVTVAATVLGGGCYWLAFIAVKVGKTHQCVSTIASGLKDLRKDVDDLDDRVDGHDLRLTRAEMRLEA